MKCECHICKTIRDVEASRRTYELEREIRAVAPITTSVETVHAPLTIAGIIADWWNGRRAA